jgi:hypothetical protein
MRRGPGAEPLGLITKKVLIFKTVALPGYGSTELAEVRERGKFIGNSLGWWLVNARQGELVEFEGDCEFFLLECAVP